MPSGGLSRAIDNRSLADDPETPRRMELSKRGGRRGCAMNVYPFSVWQGYFLKWVYLYQLNAMFHKGLVRSLLNESDSNRKTDAHKLNAAVP